MDKQALEQRIAAAEKELSEMRTLLKKDLWTAEDIVAGAVAMTKDGHKVLILSTGHSLNCPRFCIAGLAGLYGNALQLYSNMNDLSSAKMAELLSYKEYKKCGNIAEDIYKLLRDA